jgi:hypothetical protein
LRTCWKVIGFMRSWKGGYVKLNLVRNIRTI